MSNYNYCADLTTTSQQCHNYKSITEQPSTSGMSTAVSSYLDNGVVTTAISIPFAIVAYLILNAVASWGEKIHEQQMQERNQ